MSSQSGGTVESGQVWRGLGRPMLVKRVAADRALLTYMDHSEEWWEDVTDIVIQFTLVGTQSGRQP